jgi:hypothetical protein
MEQDATKHYSALLLKLHCALFMSSFFRGVCSNILQLPTMEFLDQMVLACFWVFASLFQCYWRTLYCAYFYFPIL